MIKGYKKLVKKINTVFVAVVLFVLYYPILGICVMLYLLTKTRTKKNRAGSYWLKPEKNIFKKDYFKSAY